MGEPTLQLRNLNLGIGPVSMDQAPFPQCVKNGDQCSSVIAVFVPDELHSVANFFAAKKDIGGFQLPNLFCQGFRRNAGQRSFQFPEMIRAFSEKPQDSGFPLSRNDLQSR